MSNWFMKLRKCDNPILRVFCFPYAGGNGYSFFNLARHLPVGVELYGINAPGRLQRYEEPPITCVHEKVEILLDEIQGYLDVPRLTLAYSNGTLTAYELERHIQYSGNNNLAHIILCAKNSPNLPSDRPPFSKLAYDQKIRLLDSFSIIPKNILYDASAMAELMPLIDADFSLSDNHNFVEYPKLVSSASVFAGAKDNYCSLEQVWAWKELIDGPVDCVRFNGDHFFKYLERERFIFQVNRTIARQIQMLR